MKLSFTLLCLTILLAHFVDSAEAAAKRPSIKFRNAEYFHRWSQNTQHEYTPKGQQDLKKWSDMVTLNFYPKAKDGDALAQMANSTLENYKAAEGVILKTSSVPATLSKPAEHLIVVVFGRPDFLEAAFARFVMNKGIGTSVVYSHRIYGKKAGNAMSGWLKKNGEKIEADLMKWSGMPKS
jgi:hypothetical protein